jgi:glycosyltransferase involved in cell wall biosynthesis
VSTPLVSIGLPVYNGERFISQAIESILGQTFRDLELVICDNASTDGTESICRGFARQDARVRYVRNARNRGAAHNYNLATALSCGKYIRHAAHDDVLAPSNIERCVAVLEADPAVALAYPQMSRIDEHGATIDTFRGSLVLDQPDPVQRWRCFLAAIDEGSMCDPVFGLFRADILKATPVLRVVMGADMILLGDVALRGRIVEIPEVLFFERWHAGTSVNANPTLDDRAAWFDPAARGKLLNAVPHWCWLGEYAKSVAAAPLTRAQRAACLLALGPWAWRHKRGLALGPLALVARLTGAPAMVTRADRAVLGVK